ncbi:sigma-70 family RNA polymerase sigma factor [Actinoplanes sp. NPDC051851]|uniref:sigma-70 family RNA polymerase sigma factor n=1 Tax=Actinoplanes sp. NPDC051851 TaxID=3154753 RepID=UPI003420EE41
MRADGAERVRAARGGDRAALEGLVADCLPMVYTLVGQALDDDVDVDDVVQDVMVRALRKLPALRTPESFRPWLAAITLRQISTHRDRVARAAERTAPLDEAAEAGPDGVPERELELSAQRRQVRQAGRWLDAADRSLLALWWLEVAGRMTRAELASALGVTVAHAGVRIQRMRRQLDLSRTVVAALRARPPCPGLGAALTGWDTVPGPRWRKRAARHIRTCPACTGVTDGLTPTDHLLPSLILLPAPTTLTGAVLAEHGGGVAATAAATATTATKAALLGAAAHPVIAAVAAGALAVGATVTTVRVSTPETTTPPPVAAPATTSPSRSTAPASAPTSGTTLLRAGPVSLESVNAAGRYVTAAGTVGVLTAVTPANTTTARRQATFQAVAGLADPGCLSFRTADGRYLRHSSWRIRVAEEEGTALFRGDATFCPRAGAATGSVTLESANYPGWFLRHRNDDLWVDQAVAGAAFRADSSFRVRPPLAD